MFRFEKKLKNFLYIILLFILLLFGCKKQVNKPVSNVQETNLKKHLAELNLKKYDTLVRQEYEKLMRSYYNKKDREYYLSAIDFEKNATNSKDTVGIITAKINLGQFYYNNFKVDSSYYYYSSAEKLSLKLKDKPYLGAILICKATVLVKEKNHSEAQSIAFEALKIAKQSEYYDYVLSSFLLIGNSLEGMNKDEEAINYYNKALTISTKLPNSIQKEILISSTYTELAKVYQKSNDYEKVIEYVNKGLNCKVSKQENINTYCYLKNILAKAIYTTQKEQALSIYNETLRIGDSLNYAPIQVATQLQLGEYYFYYKDSITANFYLQNAKKLAHENQLFEDELITLKLLSKTNPKKNQYFSERYIRLNDSLQTVERATRDKFARIEFETDEISNQKKLVELKNKKLTTRFLFSAALIILLLLFLYFWYKNKSNKAKIYELKLLQEKQELENNKLLLLREQQSKDEKIYQLLLSQQEKIEEGKQLEKKRISRELHDGIMGKLSGIRLNLYILKKKTDPETIGKCLEFVKDIQTIENELRLLSHDLNKTSFSTAKGIENEITNIFKEIKNHQKIDFELEIDRLIIWDTMNYTLKLNLYRIIQEALHNIDKYAKADKVSISIFQSDQFLSIEIVDDGVGFDLNSNKKGIGLKNMKERTEELGGIFTINSFPKKGTKINLLLPN